MSPDQTTGQYQPPHQPYPPPAKKKTGLIVAGVIAAVAVVAAISGLIYLSMSLDKNKVTSAKVGDCVRDEPADEDIPYRLVACTDPQAKYKTLSILSTSGSCREVAGASRSVSTGDHNVCLGDKDVDPPKAVNVAKEGDCLNMTPSEPQRVECASTEATHKIIKRIVDVPSFQASGVCRTVNGSTLGYSWNWESNSDFGASKLQVDVVLCLGPK